MRDPKSVELMDYLIDAANRVLTEFNGEDTTNAWRVVQTETKPRFPSVIFRITAENRSGALRPSQSAMGYTFAMVACAKDYTTAAKLDDLLVKRFQKDRRILVSTDVEDTFEKLNDYILQRVRLVTVT